MASFTQNPSGQTTVLMSVDTVDLTIGPNEDQITWYQKKFIWSNDSIGGSLRLAFPYIANQEPAIQPIWRRANRVINIQ